MNIPQPPRRQAALKASTQLAELSSSDEASDARNNIVAGHKAAGRVKRGGSTNKGGRKRNPKRPAEGARGSGVVRGENDGHKKRKRGNPPWTGGPPPKRRRASPFTENFPTIGGEGDEESDLTPCSSDSEQNHSRPPGFDCPFPFPSPVASVGSRLGRNSKKVNSTKLGSFPDISDLDEDSDGLPDVGTVLSQGTIGPKTPRTTNKDKLGSARRNDRSYTRDTLLPSTSSPTLLYSTLPWASRGISTGDDVTEEALSDFIELPDLDDDLDMDDMDDDTQTYKDELCLAKAYATETVYWPAKVLGVKAAEGKGRSKHKRIFQVVFLDKTEKEIPREWFYTSWQDEFSTCKIGEFESSHVEVVDDIDEDSKRSNPTRIAYSHAYTSRSRSPSPEPIVVPSPPLSGPAYCNLSLRQQFAYVKPVLSAIMNEQYTAGKRRHESFVKGGASRSRLAKEGGMRGSLDARAVDELLILVERWCLGGRGREGFVDNDGNGDGCREQRHQNEEPDGGPGSASQNSAPEEAAVVDTCPSATPLQNALPEAEAIEPALGLQELQAQPTDKAPTEGAISTPDATTTPPIQPQQQSPASPHKHERPRQHGSPAYESLSPLDKVQYCIEVLLPEAIIQILLWRIGERRSVEVMQDTPEEEERLYQRGEGLLKETDWVMDVMRLRGQLKRRLEEKETRGKGTHMKERELRRTRSGRVGGIVGSYRE